MANLPNPIQSNPIQSNPTMTNFQAINVNYPALQACHHARAPGQGVPRAQCTAAAGPGVVINARPYPKDARSGPPSPPIDTTTVGTRDISDDRLGPKDSVSIAERYREKMKYESNTNTSHADSLK